MFRIILRVFGSAAGVFLLLSVSSPAPAAGLNMKFLYTMPVGVDPDRQIFFAFDGDAQTFTGADLFSNPNPGVEFHVADAAPLQVDQVALDIVGTIPTSLQPLTAEVLSLFDPARYPDVKAPWLDVPPTSFPFALQDQPGAARIGQLLTDALSGAQGRAFGALELTPDSLREIGALDPGSLADFESLTFRATARDASVPEPGAFATGLAALIGGSLLFARRRA